MHVIGKRVKGLVDVQEEPEHKWIGTNTYIVRYEDCSDRGHYITAEFIADSEILMEISRAMAELEFQKQGLEFPTQ